jgi:hypothetical protein
MAEQIRRCLYTKVYGPCLRMQVLVLRRTSSGLRTALYQCATPPQTARLIHDDARFVFSRISLHVSVRCRLPLKFVGPRSCCTLMHQSRSRSPTLLHAHDNVFALQHIIRIPRMCRDMVAMSSICRSYQKSAPATWPLGIFRSNGQTK